MDAGMPVPPPRVEALMLVDADTDKDIRAVEDGAVLDLAQLPPNLAMRADTDPPTVGSVTFRIDAGQPRIDSMAPYSVSGDVGTNISPWMLALGAHTVNAVAFDAANGGGKAGEPLEVDFTLTRSDPPAPDRPLDAGVGVGVQAGAAGGLPIAGNGTAVNPALGAGFDASIPAIAARQEETTGGCGCSVPGERSSSTGTTGTWALAALALGLFMQRRARSTRRAAANDRR
jgi:MYXO-CTERM domain-containing protein